MNTAVLSMAFAIAGGATGQLLMKSGMQLLPTILDASFMHTKPMLLNFTLLLGLGIALYFLSMIAWIITLKHFSLNFAYPLLGLSYVLVYLLASIWPGLYEPVTLQKSIGVFIIMMGVWVSSIAHEKEC